MELNQSCNRVYSDTKCKNNVNLRVFTSRNDEKYFEQTKIVPKYERLIKSREELDTLPSLPK